jgi:long-subunit acyl-CoA synthetase (AMP-forming)
MYICATHAGKATHALWDRLIFNKIKKSLGFERLNLMVTGSAPIAGHVLTFMRILLVCSIGHLTYEIVMSVFQLLLH